MGKEETLTEEQLATAIKILEPTYPAEPLAVVISPSYLVDLRSSGFLTEDELTQLLKGSEIKGIILAHAVL